MGRDSNPENVLEFRVVMASAVLHFPDTNVLVYARDAAAVAKQTAAAAWMERLWREGTGRLSWQVLEEFYVTWWDALIVAAAETADCPYLLTEDLAAGQRLGTVTIVDPFATAPTAELEAPASG